MVLFCENSTKVFSTIDINNISEICDIGSAGNYRGIGDLNKSASDMDKNETVLAIYSKAKATPVQKPPTPTSKFNFLNFPTQTEPPIQISIKLHRFTQKPTHTSQAPKWAPTKNALTIADQGWEEIDLIK